MAAAYEETLKTISRPAASDLSAKEYYFVTVDSSGNLAASVPGDRPLGILQDKPAAAGRAGRVAISGVSKVVLGGTVTAGDAMGFDTNGAGVTLASGDSDSVGICVVGGNSGDVGSVVLQMRGRS